MENPQRKIVNTWKVISLIFIFCACLPFLLHWDMPTIGYGFISISGIMVLIGIIIILVYNKRAKLLDKLLNGENVMAHWRYAADEWIRYTEYDFEERKKTSRKMLLVMSIIAAIAGIILSFVVGNILPLIICAGIILLVAIPAILVPVFARRRNEKNIGEVLLSSEAVFINGVFHNWNMMSSRLETVVLVDSIKPHIIKLVYSYPTKNGRSETEVRIPVPKAEEASALSVVKELKKSLK